MASEGSLAQLGLGLWPRSHHLHPVAYSKSLKQRQDWGAAKSVALEAAQIPHVCLSIRHDQSQAA